MHFCTAMIALGGDKDNVYYADEFAPVSWPEVQVIQFIHGDDAVDQVKPFVAVELSPRQERQRLADKYGEDKVAEVFARSGPGEMEAPRATLADGTLWKNPITMQIEMVGGDRLVDPLAAELASEDGAALAEHLYGAAEAPEELAAPPPRRVRR